MTRVGAAPTPFYGGKGSLAPRIVALFPPHDVYVEPYLGSGAVYFAKRPAPVSILNDRDGLLVNFFRVLRDPVKGLRLREALDLTPYAREEWAECQLGVKRVAQMNWRDAGDDVELARRWFVLAQMSFAGRISYGDTAPARDRLHERSGWRFAMTPGHNPATTFRTAIARLPQFTAQLSTAQIEHDEALEVIARFDGPRVLQYLDPPYEPSTRSGGDYAYEMSVADHERLLDLVTGPTFRSMVVLSGYDSALYRERLERASGWQRLEIVTTTAASSRTRQTRTEILWLNPAAQRRQGLWASLDAGLDESADEPTPEPLTTVGKGHSTERRQPSTRKGKATHGR